MASRSSTWGPHRSSWELRQYTARPEADGSDDDLEVEIDNMTPSKCSTKFMNLLIELKLASALSAKQVCLLAFWAKGGSLCDPGATLSLRPGQSGGNYSRHFDRCVGLDKELKGELYKVPLPGSSRTTLGRCVLPGFAHLVYKDLQEELTALPDVKAQIRRGVEEAFWGPLLRDHVLKHGAQNTALRTQL